VRHFSTSVRRGISVCCRLLANVDVLQRNLFLCRKAWTDFTQTSSDGQRLRWTMARYLLNIVGSNQVRRFTIGRQLSMHPQETDPVRMPRQMRHYDRSVFLLSCESSLFKLTMSIILARQTRRHRSRVGNSIFPVCDCCQFVADNAIITTKSGRAVQRWNEN
jgi:hypothetical protein